MTADLDGTLQLLGSLRPVQSYGKVTKVVGLVAEGRGIKAPLGSLCQTRRTQHNATKQR